MWIDRQDFLYSLRSMRRTPLLTAVAIAALSLGIGLNTGVFSLLNALLLSPPTQVDPSSFVQVYPRYESGLKGAEPYSAFTTEDFEAVRSHATALKDLAGFGSMPVQLNHDRLRVGTMLVTCNFPAVISGNHALVGRSLIADDCRRNAGVSTVLLDEATWKRRFHSDAKIVGQVIDLNGAPFTVVGVLKSEGTDFRSRGIYVPYTQEPLLVRNGPSHFGDNDSQWLQVYARLRPGVSRATAEAELTSIMRAQDQVYLQHKHSIPDRKTTVEMTNGSFVQNPWIRYNNVFETLMTLMLAPLLLVLLLACSNVTMLFLSRAVVRRAEMSVRLALGAGKSRLLQMLVLESLMVAVVAGVMSLALAYLVPHMIISAIDPDAAYVARSMPMDWHLFGYLALLVGLAAVVSSLAPMHSAWKLDLVTALKGREGSATMRSRLTSALIIAQVAMSFVLMAAAVLFLRIPGKITGMDAGFETHQLMVVSLDTDFSKERHDAMLDQHRAIEERIAALPGVAAVSYAEVEPFRGASADEVRSTSQKKGDGMQAVVDHVSPNFFDAFAVRILRGRAFLGSEKGAAKQGSVAIVSKAFAREFWPDKDPVGKVVVTSDDLHFTVVGVAADMRSEHYGVVDGPRLYLPRDPAMLSGQMYVRFSGSEQAMEKAVAEAVNGVDTSSLLMAETIWANLLSDADEMRPMARITLVVASVAVLLAMTGIYAVLSFATQQRTREFGIRMVLGAGRFSIFRLILTRGVLQTVSGVMLGLLLATPASIAFSRITQRSTLHIEGFDPAVYGIAAVLLLIVAMAAMYLPALRATKVDPVVSLRSE